MKPERRLKVSIGLSLLIISLTIAIGILAFKQGGLDMWGTGLLVVVIICSQVVIIFNQLTLGSYLKVIKFLEEMKNEGDHHHS